METCKICNKVFNKLGGLNIHLSTLHKYDRNMVKAHYNTYYRKPGEGLCLFSNVETEFLGLTQGYAKYDKSNPEVRKKALSTNTIEFLVKVKGMTLEQAEEYNRKYHEDLKKKCKEVRISEMTKDPDYQKKQSRYCKEFWILKGYTESEAIEKANSECAKNRKIFESKLKNKPEKYKNRWQSQLQYWIDKGYSEDEARLKLTERQKTFTIEKLTKKHGKEKAERLFTDRQKKWLMNYKKTNYSKISQHLFIDVYNALEQNSKNSCRFAVLDAENNKLDWSGINHEYILKLNE